jgi:Tol biopolymer transport system component
VAVETGDPRDPDKKCFQVVDINDDDERVGKPACGMELISISPDGRYVVLEPVADGDTQNTPYTFVDVRTGRTVMKLQADTWNGITWEPDGTHVVLNAFAGNRNALVRCDLSGRCELASTPVSWEESDLYALAIN